MQRNHFGWLPFNEIPINVRNRLARPKATDPDLRTYSRQLLAAAKTADYRSCQFIVFSFFFKYSSIIYAMYVMDKLDSK